MSSRALLRRLLPKTLWGDRLYGSYLFRRRLGRWPERRPVRFNDRLFALKTDGSGYDPLIQFVTDKEHAKLWIAAIAGERHVVETYRILRSREELAAFRPDRFPCILKPTHSSGQAAVCLDASAPLDRDAMAQWFDIDLYGRKREQNYRWLKPKIIVEEFVSDDGRTIPDDYKIFCFDGVPRFVQVDSDRFTGHRRNLYDTGWNRIPAALKYPNREADHPRPARLDDMLALAGRLSAPFRFVRVDLYVTAGGIRVGELSFVPDSATGLLTPPEAEYTLGAFFDTGNAP